MKMALCDLCRVGRCRLTVGAMRRVVVFTAIALGAAVFAPGVGERDRSESAAIGAIRAVVSAEKAYAAMTGGYDTLECLATSSCIPGIDQDRRRFLDPSLATSRRIRGYHLAFHRGPEAGNGGRKVSATAMTRFAVVALPAAPGAASRRAFCGDDSGSIYLTPGDRVPRVSGGRCLDKEHPLP